MAFHVHAYMHMRLQRLHRRHRRRVQIRSVVSGDINELSLSRHRLVQSLTAQIRQTQISAVAHDKDQFRNTLDLRHRLVQTRMRIVTCALVWSHTHRGQRQLERAAAPAPARAPAPALLYCFTTDSLLLSYCFTTACCACSRSSTCLHGRFTRYLRGQCHIGSCLHTNN